MTGKLVPCIKFDVIGTWQMLGNYRELAAIERNACEEAYGAPDQ
jgi:hypothetical protein